MAVTARLGIQLMDDAQQGKAINHNAAINAIDAAIAGLTLNNAFTGNNTFAGTTKLTGALGGNGTLLPLAEAIITFPSDADYTLGTTVATEKEAVWVTINNGVITVQRNLIVPATTGGPLVITNNNTFGVQVKTAAGTGIVVASNRRAFLKAGTNVTRVTADSVTSP